MENDNMFEVALASATSFKELSRLLVQVGNEDVKTIPGVTYYQTNNFEIEFLDPVNTSWCLDGEEYKIDNYKYSFHVEQSMKMLVPKESAQELFYDE